MLTDLNIGWSSGYLSRRDPARLLQPDPSALFQLLQSVVGFCVLHAEVKKLLTGSGKASKDEVAAALEKYIVKQDYATDDESDAVAIGIAWLILCEFL